MCVAISANYDDVIHRSSGREEVANVPSGGSLAAVRVALRILIGTLIVALVGIAMVPLLVLRDLTSGGSGWGLCGDGVRQCSTSYFTGLELVAMLLAALFVVLILLRAATRGLRWVEHQEDRTRTVDARGAAASVDEAASRNGHLAT